MPISSLIVYTLMKLFRKPGNWRQICEPTSSAFLYIKRCISLKLAEKKLGTLLFAAIWPHEAHRWSGLNFIYEAKYKTLEN